MRITPLSEGGARLVLHELDPEGGRLCQDVAAGLARPHKQIPPKYFYDERGARLFERISELDAYYPTRTELAILHDHVGDMAARIGPERRVIEFGSGSGIKTMLLLEHLEDPVAYVPIDVSRAQLVEFARSTAERFGSLEVLPVWADYTTLPTLPAPSRKERRTLAYFPGSTIGNFEPESAAAFLRHVARLCGRDARMLLGVDLKKDAAVIELAYNDPQGVTAEFNLNLLARVNRECGADFDVDSFRHEAVFDGERGRVEMRLVSSREQTVRLPAEDGAAEIRFAAGEAITTEYSYKYDMPRFTELANRAGWTVDRSWMDDRQWFAVCLLSLP